MRLNLSKLSDLSVIVHDKHSCKNPLNYYDLNTVECDCQIIPKAKPDFICVRTEI